MVIGPMHIENGNGLAERGPDAIVIHARGHHHHQHLVAVDLGHVHDFLEHGFFGLTVALAPDRPGMHLLGHVAERRDFPDIVEILLGGLVFGNLRVLIKRHGWLLFSHAMPQRRIGAAALAE